MLGYGIVITKTLYRGVVGRNIDMRGVGGGPCMSQQQLVCSDDIAGARIVNASYNDCFMVFQLSKSHLAIVEIGYYRGS